MKDLSGLAHSFQEWSAILDFLAGIRHAKDVQITKGDKEWTMKINVTDINDKHKPKTPGAALYDLYW